MTEESADIGKRDVPAENVIESLGSASVCVEECCWERWQPNLPREVTALLAEPVVVEARRLARP